MKSMKSVSCNQIVASRRMASSFGLRLWPLWTCDDVRIFNEAIRQVGLRVKMKQFTSIRLKLCYNCHHLPQTVLNVCASKQNTASFIKIKENSLHFLPLAKSRCSNLLASCRPCIIKCISNSLTFLCFAFVPFMSLFSLYFVVLFHGLVLLTATTCCVSILSWYHGSHSSQ